MKAVILAAGMGTRLGTLIPKPLTSIIDEKTVMDFQVERLASVVGMDNIIAVVGYKKELIMEKFPNITYVYNAAYTLTNTAKSLLCALRKVDEDTIWMNGDVFFQPEALDLIKDVNESTLLVDVKKCGDEEIKYTLDDAGNIKNLSKTVSEGVGESVGINVVKQKDLKTFIKGLETVGNQDYFEKAIEDLILQKKMVVKPAVLGDTFCQEIDFDSDLQETVARARELGLL